MSGPFSEDEVFNILGGHFVSSPLGVVEKAGEPGKFRVVRDLSYQNSDGYSVNGFLDSDDFPTEWGTAAQIAEIVSTPSVKFGRLDVIFSCTFWRLVFARFGVLSLRTLRRLALARFGVSFLA